jgi:hypothetical protein
MRMRLNDDYFSDTNLTSPVPWIFEYVYTRTVGTKGKQILIDYHFYLFYRVLLLC